jgi:hypothetical protein
MATPSLVLYDVVNDDFAHTGTVPANSSNSANETHVIPAGEVWLFRLSGFRPVLQASNQLNATFTANFNNGVTNVSATIQAFPTAASTTSAYPNPVSGANWALGNLGGGMALIARGGQTMTITATKGSTTSSAGVLQAATSCAFGYTIEKYRSSI